MLSGFKEKNKAYKIRKKQTNTQKENEDSVYNNTLILLAFASLKLSVLNINLYPLTSLNNNLHSYLLLLLYYFLEVVQLINSVMQWGNFHEYFIVVEHARTLFHHSTKNYDTSEDSCRKTVKF